MSHSPLLPFSKARVDTELRRAREQEAAEQDVERHRRRVMWQCVALSFAGVPLYAVSWRIAADRAADIVAALGFFISYAVPFFRWLAYLVKSSDAFGA